MAGVAGVVVVAEEKRGESSRLQVWCTEGKGPGRVVAARGIAQNVA